MILGNSYSCTGSIDVFSQFEDLVLRDMLYGSSSSLRVRTGFYGCFNGRADRTGDWEMKLYGYGLNFTDDYRALRTHNAVVSYATVLATYCVVLGPIPSTEYL